ncbi:hypothetical protein [Bradyrhizobium genosp. P]|uniref:hypothetical protein n=1 Tax=Bradyrhizobium genosp. P TaxID=83641 RepID=UPI003CFB252E
MVRSDDIANMAIYFDNHRVFTVMDAQQKEAGNFIQQINADEFLNMPIDDLIDQVVEKYRFDVPVLLRDEAHLEEPREVRLTVNDYGRTIHPMGTVLTLVVPFTGDPGMFWVQPSQFNSAPPRGNLSNNRLVLKVQGTNLNQEQVSKGLMQTLDEFAMYLGWLRKDAQTLDETLRRNAKDAIAARRERLLKDRNLVANLPFKIRARSDSPKTYVAPVTRKNVIQRTPISAPFRPEPAMDSAIYEEILEIMHNMTLVMERSPTSFKKMGEEDIRQQFLVQLNGRFEGTATGETFNFEGKTDILVRVEGKNIFIAECKFWGGQKAYLETIDQLLGYLSWRDTKTCVAIFNRNKDFSNVLKSIREATELHHNKKRGPDILGETRFRYTFSNPKDTNRELILTVMAFDIPQ